MRILVRHLQNAKESLVSFAQQAGLAEHGVNSGTAREGVARHFLQQNLPATVRYLTGEIFDSHDDRSGQIDLVVYPLRAPKLHLQDDINLVLSDYVIAAIEVKSTLTTASWDSPSHLKSALESCRKVKQLARKHPIRGVYGGAEVSLSKTPYMIFAYGGPTTATLEAKLNEYQDDGRLDYDLMPDIITVLSRDYYLVKNNGWLISHVPGVRWSSNQAPASTLLGMWAYLTKLIESYELSFTSMPFTEYLRDSKKDA